MKNEIEQNSQHPILIDVIPNMKFFSKKGSMVRDCEEDLKQFELDVVIYYIFSCYLHCMIFHHICCVVTYCTLLFHVV